MITSVIPKKRPGLAPGFLRWASGVTLGLLTGTAAQATVLTLDANGNYVVSPSVSSEEQAPAEVQTSGPVEAVLVQPEPSDVDASVEPTLDKVETEDAQTMAGRMAAKILEQMETERPVRRTSGTTRLPSAIVAGMAREATATEAEADSSAEATASAETDLPPVEAQIVATSEPEVILFEDVARETGGRVGSGDLGPVEARVITPVAAKPVDTAFALALPNEAGPVQARPVAALDKMPAMARVVDITPTIEPLVPSPNATRFDGLIRQEVAKYDNVDFAFVKSVIEAESNYNLTAVSPKGAMGLMQIMPDTAARYAVVNPFSAEQNIRAGTAELSRLMTLYRNPALALAGYNAGETAVKTHDGVPPYRETQEYIVRVLTRTFAKRDAMSAPEPEPTIEVNALDEAEATPKPKKHPPMAVQSYDW